MNKKLILAILAVALVAAPADAKRKVFKEYQRPSLHMVLLNTDEPTSDQVADLIPEIAVAWDQYEIPAQYNELPLSLKTMNGGSPEGGLMELVTRYGTYDKLKGLSQKELESLQSLQSGKQYIEDLKKRCATVSNDVAHEMLMHWFNIQPDGSYSLDTIAKYACYGATQVAALDAAATTNEGAQITMLNELMDPTIANSYITFSKIALYANEPVAAFTRNLAFRIADIAAEAAKQGGANSQIVDLTAAGAKAIAEAAYQASKDGYSAYCTSLLYKLTWNESICAKFFKLMTPADPSNPWTGKIDMKAFKAMPLALEFVNSDHFHNVVTRTIKNKNENNAGLTRQTIKKNLNKQLVHLQNKNEGFKTMVPIVDVQPKYIVADMGTKESVTANEVFNIIAPETDKRGVVKYKVVGQVKVKKGTIWDNEAVDMAEVADVATATQEEVAIQGTQLTGAGVKNAQPGMFVKRKRASKKK